MRRDLTNRWTVLGLLCVVRVSIGMQFQSIPAVAPFVIRDLGINYAQVGLLIGLFMLPGAFLALPGGLLSARFGDRALVLGALASLTVGAALVAAGSSFRMAFAGRLVSGAGGVLLNMQLTKITTDWFAGKETSTAMGLLLSMWPLGMALSLATLGGLATATSWRTAITATAAYSAVCLALFLALHRDAPAAGPPPARGRPPFWIISNREAGLIVWSGLAWMVLNTAFVVFMSFTPTLLMGRGLSVAQAGFLVSWASWISIGSVPLGGYLIDRTGRSTLFMVLGSAATALICFVVPLWGPASLWMVLFGIALAPTAGIIALPAEVLRPESRSMGFGAFYTIYYSGMALLPAVAGYLLDVTGSAAGPVWFGGLLWLLVLPALGAFRLFQRRWTPAQ